MLGKELASGVEARDDDPFIADAKLLLRQGVALLHEDIVGWWLHAAE